MHITIDQLTEILDDDAFLRLHKNDILDWPCFAKDIFVMRYLEKCNLESRQEIMSESNIDILKLFTDHSNFLIGMRNAIYQYLENTEANDLLSLRSMIQTQLELIRQGYCEENILHEKI